MDVRYCKYSTKTISRPQLRRLAARISKTIHTSAEFHFSPAESANPDHSHFGQYGRTPHAHLWLEDFLGPGKVLIPGHGKLFPLPMSCSKRKRLFRAAMKLIACRISMFRRSSCAKAAEICHKHIGNLLA